MNQTNHAENSRTPLLQTNSTSGRLLFLFSVGCAVVLTLVYASKGFNFETPVSGLQFTYKRGSEETKEFLQIYQERLVAAWKFADKRNMFSMQTSHGYMDIIARVKSWVAWADQPDFYFFYLYDKFEDNVQAASGVKIFRTGELMQRVKKYGRREFEARINSRHCESTPDTRPPWIYLDDIFSHDIAYMVGIHKFPTVDTRQLIEILVPNIFETINSLVDTNIWEYWIPRPLGRMPEKLSSLGFTSTQNVYVKADGTSWERDWMYNAIDFVAAFNEFVIKKNDVPQGQLIILSREFSFARLGNKTHTRQATL